MAVLPFESVANLIFLPVKIEGRDAGTWILDSGFEYSVVDRRVADGAGLQASPDRMVRAPGGSIREAWTGRTSFDIGPLAFTAESLSVIDLSGLEPIVGRRMHGVLGHDVFEHYVLAIDYVRGRVEVYDPATFRYAGTGTSLPVWIERGEPFVTGLLYADGRVSPAKLKVDTGSLDFLGLNGSYVGQVNLVSPQRPRVPVLGAAIGGRPTGFVTSLDSVVIGPFRVAQPIVSFSADLTRDGDAGTLGADLLRRFRVIFDYQHRRIILEPNRALADPTAFDASGVSVIAPGPNFSSVQVLSVEPGSPAAAAGLRAGDVIVELDGVRATVVTLLGARTSLWTPGHHVELVVERDGHRLPLMWETRQGI